MEHLLIGFDSLRKRPMVRSLRFKAMVGLGARAGAAFAAAAWKGLERFVRPSDGTGGNRAA